MADGEENSASPAGTPTAAEPPKKGMSAFLDVFRRADKNDDGKLSWYEFKTYFDDGSLSETELGELFHRIDTHNTNNIDVGELCDYFSQQLGPFEQVYSALEDLNSSINTALMSTAQVGRRSWEVKGQGKGQEKGQVYSALEDLNSSINTALMSTAQVGQEVRGRLKVRLKGKGQVYSALEDLNSSINTALMSTAQVRGRLKVRLKDYPSMPQEGQFMRRFLLKEVLNQMESQQRSVDVASEHLEQESGSQDPVDANVEEEPQLSRARRRDIRRQMSGLSRLESHEDNSAALTQQVSRLKTLLDTLQSKVRLQPIEEELDMEDGASLVQVVQRRMEMEEDKEEEFRKALREYLEAVEGTDGCINLCVCRTPDREHIILYEIWAGTEAWKSHVSSSVSKTFQHKVIDLLAQPEQMSTISIPDRCRMKTSLKAG
uniref:Uncharacterized protein n=1 Tax=Branchiostoma floridae TaxID=7739 RepID=C3ZDH4_BRAFL|eukprot:XP_002592769.1 hypothetical protein BRAFLDRAFT_65349 [Branchiostoma floridae]